VPKCCEYGNISTGSKNNWIFLDKLGGYQLIEQGSIQRSYHSTLKLTKTDIDM
jgi:hypothetical protein